MQLLPVFSAFCLSLCLPSNPSPPSLPSLFPSLFTSVEMCPALGGIENADVIYSRHFLDKERGYCAGTTARAVCHTGYKGGGEVFCREGTWSSDLPSCQSETISLFCRNFTFFHCNIIRACFFHEKYFGLYSCGLWSPTTC